MRPLRIQSQCGCVGSIGNGAPVNPTIVQSWDGNLKGSQWELGFDDASVCDTGIKVVENIAGGTERMRDVTVQAKEQTTESSDPSSSSKEPLSLSWFWPFYVRPAQ